MLAAETTDVAIMPGDTGTQARIVAMAEQQFRDVGYRKTTVADIARALRMSPANVYRFFDSKKAINEAVVARLIGSLERKLRVVADDTTRPATSRLRDVIRVMHEHNVELFCEHPRMQEVVDAAMTESWSVCQHHIGRISALFADVVLAGVEAGEFETDDSVGTARCIHAAILRFCHPMLVVQAHVDFMPSLEEMTDFLLAALRKGTA